MAILAWRKQHPVTINKTMNCCINCTVSWERNTMVCSMYSIAWHYPVFIKWSINCTNCTTHAHIHIGLNMGNPTSPMSAIPYPKQTNNSQSKPGRHLSALWSMEEEGCHSRQLPRTCTGRLALLDVIAELHSTTVCVCDDPECPYLWGYPFKHTNLNPIDPFGLRMEINKPIYKFAACRL